MLTVVVVAGTVVVVGAVDPVDVVPGTVVVVVDPVDVVAVVEDSSVVGWVRVVVGVAEVEPSSTAPLAA
jgi:hypothetical protein